MDVPGLKTKMKTGGPSPERTANIFTLFTWQWVQPFITLGNKKIIQAEDLYDLLPRETTAYCEQQWNKSYEKQKRETGKTPSVLKLMIISCGREMVWSFLACPIWLAALVAQVFVLRELVNVAEQRNQHLPWWKGFLLVLGMLLTSNVQSITQHYTFTAGQKSGMKIRSAVSMAVFNKLMRLKTVALGGTSSGQMLNLIMNDTQKFLDCATFAGFSSRSGDSGSLGYSSFLVWACAAACFGVVDSVVVAALAIAEVGVSALPGVAVIILAQTVQLSVAHGVGEMRKRAVKLTDARVRTIQEILSGVRVVKYNGWTTAFLGRIQDLRTVEMGWIKKAAFFKASMSTLREGVAPLAALVTFGTYVGLHGGNFSASKAFTLLGLFSILVRVYSICPTGVQAAWESKIGFQRLQRLMDLSDGKGNSSDEEIEQIRKIYPQASVAVSGGTFTWHLKDQENAEASAHLAGRTTKPRHSISKQVHTDLTQKEVPGNRTHDAGLIDEQDEQQVATGTLKGIDMEVSNGELIAVIGSVGSGKSSLLYAILGEMECEEGAFFMDRTVSYAPQQPWILNDTIRNNILFASDYDEARYNKTLFACALDHDILTMPAGDKTEIGERGVNLSGGQKARVSLARACYSPSKVVLLDDPLAAVDVPTARHLMEHVLSGILKGRTVILVTHNKSSLELCDRVLLMQNGELQEVEPKEEVLQKILLPEDEPESDDELLDTEEDFTLSFRKSEDGTLVEGTFLEGEGLRGVEPAPPLSFSVENSEVPAGLTESAPVVRRSSDLKRVSFKKCGSVPQESKRPSMRNSFAGDIAEAKAAAAAQSLGALTVKEDRAEGEVTYKTYLNYCRGSGLWLWAFAIFLMCFGQAVRVMVDYWVSIWVSDKYHLSTHLYLGIYAIWVIGMLFFSLSRGLVFTDAAIRAAKSMHRVMAQSVLRSPQLFFDQNPVGRIMNRFSKDQSMVDELLPWTAQGMFENLVGVLGVMVLVATIMPWFLLSLPPFLFALWYCQRRYVAVSRELKRLDGMSRSPVYAHFTQTLQGVTSVRAYGTETTMHDHFRDWIDANNRAYVLFVHTSRWLGIRLDFAAALCLTTSALLAILLRKSVNPGLIGVVLVQSLQLTGFFQYGVRLIADTENIFTSVERNQSYGNLPSEADPNSPPGLITDDWPQKGKVEFIKYTMAYRTDLLPVLNNLTFTVLPQEKVGILGRTGAGKSSLAAALFRMVENTACSGNIYIDGIDIALVGLDDLRLRLSIIPQDPVLFRGTVRLNLDPFEQHSDVEIYEALAKVQLTAKIKSLDSGLDSTVTENGDNFSVGQRQLLCLARSLLRRSKIIIMDEATAAVDGETDQLIQKTMRNVFHDCTVLTIAHRIDTVIDCDRVLVLAKGGRISEFDSPVNLLRHAEEVNLSDTTTMRTDHVFANMVSQAGPTLAKQLRDAAEAAERKRLARHESEI